MVSPTPKLQRLNTFYLNQAIYKQRRQAKSQENFDKLKSSSYNKHLQAESFIIIYANPWDRQDKYLQMLHMWRPRPQEIQVHQSATMIANEDGTYDSMSE